MELFLEYNAMYILIFIIGLLGTYLSIPMFKELLISVNAVRPNYKGEMIPVSMGIVFLPMLIINSLILIYININNENYIYIYMFDFSLMAMFFAGIFDDILGNRDVSGLKGHFKSLFKGKMTTGAFKALFGGFIGLIISATISKNISEIIVNTLIIALSTNLMNLLDLRPGRAIKVYLLIMIIIFLTITDFIKMLPLLILPNVIAYFKFDLEAKSMMGDAGSNILGMSVGVMMVLGYSINVRLCWLVFLIFIHIITEKYSLTEIIEKFSLINFLDKLGR